MQFFPGKKGPFLRECKGLCKGVYLLSKYSLAESLCKKAPMTFIPLSAKEDTVILSPPHLRSTSRALLPPAVLTPGRTKEHFNKTSLFYSLHAYHNGSLFILITSSGSRPFPESTLSLTSFSLHFFIQYLEVLNSFSSSKEQT